MLKQLERVRDRSFALLSANYVVGQMLNRLGRGHRSGATHSRFTLAQGVEYVTRVVDDYLRMAGWSAADLRDKRILEIGPGDNLGVALLFASAGATTVVCLDRFVSVRDEDRNRAVYRELANTVRPEFGDVRKLLDDQGAISAPNIHLKTGVAIERAMDLLHRGSFDVILSRAVLEHVYDLSAAWRSMDALLAANGIMLHKVDFRNHGIYGSLHPLRFLGVAEPLWTLVSTPDPTLNRHRLSAYEELAADSGHSLHCAVTHLSSRDAEFVPPRVGWRQGEDYTVDDLRFVEESRALLIEPFRSMSARDLLINGVFLRVRKLPA
jgi:SAM-dependent methyltransferase